MNTYELLLHRFSSCIDDTLGALFVITGPKARRFQCFTLEDEQRTVKVFGETRIPAGRYEIKLRTEGGMHGRYSERYAWHEGMLHLQGVPNFTFIYLHPGNDDDDTAGCILTGNQVRENVTQPGRLTDSLAAYKNLYMDVVAKLKAGMRVFITVKDFA